MVKYEHMLYKAIEEKVNMKKSILFMFVLLFSLSISAAADEIPGMTKSSWDVDDVAAGLFCNVEKAEVCVIARTEEDCTKLGGKKIEVCPNPEDKE